MTCAHWHHTDRFAREADGVTFYERHCDDCGGTWRVARCCAWDEEGEAVSILGFESPDGACIRPVPELPAGAPDALCGHHLFVAQLRASASDG